jgi:hypothetical protein
MDSKFAKVWDFSESTHFCSFYVDNQFYILQFSIKAKVSNCLFIIRGSF